VQHPVIESEKDRERDQKSEGDAIGHGRTLVRRLTAPEAAFPRGVGTLGPACNGGEGRMDAAGGWRDAALLGARLLIGALFLAGAGQKWVSPAGASMLLEARGLPVWLVWPALAFNLAAGLALVVGWGVVPVALLLAAYCALTSLFHWIPSDPWQMSIFVKNWAIAGGCLALAAGGPGALALRSPL
jgi:putative oxidoreductase